VLAAMLQPPRPLLNICIANSLPLIVTFEHACYPAMRFMSYKALLTSADGSIHPQRC
jgi:hypothetical protein